MENMDRRGFCGLLSCIMAAAVGFVDSWRRPKAIKDDWVWDAGTKWWMKKADPSQSQGGMDRMVWVGDMWRAKALDQRPRSHPNCLLWREFHYAGMDVCEYIWRNDNAGCMSDVWFNPATKERVLLDPLDEKRIPHKVPYSLFWVRDGLVTLPADNTSHEDFVFTHANVYSTIDPHTLEQARQTVAVAFAAYYAARPAGRKIEVQKAYYVQGANVSPVYYCTYAGQPADLLAHMEVSSEFWNAWYCGQGVPKCQPLTDFWAGAFPGWCIATGPVRQAD